MLLVQVAQLPLCCAVEFLARDVRVDLRGPIPALTVRRADVAARADRLVAPVAPGAVASATRVVPAVTALAVVTLRTVLPTTVALAPVSTRVIALEATLATVSARVITPITTEPTTVITLGTILPTTVALAPVSTRIVTLRAVLPAPIPPRIVTLETTLTTITSRIIALETTITPIAPRIIPPVPTEPTTVITLGTVLPPAVALASVSTRVVTLRTVLPPTVPPRIITFETTLTAITPRIIAPVPTEPAPIVTLRAVLPAPIPPRLILLETTLATITPRVIAPVTAVSTLATRTLPTIVPSATPCLTGSILTAGLVPLFVTCHSDLSEMLKA